MNAPRIWLPGECAHDGLVELIEAYCFIDKVERWQCRDCCALLDAPPDDGAPAKDIPGLRELLTEPSVLDLDAKSGDPA